jgi:hypothetical protein
MGYWVVAGLSVTMAIFGAEADVSAGIVITKAHSTPIGDPDYEYLLGITISASPNQPFYAGSYLQITGLIGIGLGDPADSVAGSTVADWMGVPGTNSVTFYYQSPSSDPVAPTIETDVTYAFGAFYVGPTVQFAPSAIGPEPLITYTGYDNTPSGYVTNTGTITVTYVAGVIPEPSSIVLLMAGAGAIPLLWLGIRYSRALPPRLDSDPMGASFADADQHVHDRLKVGP